MFYWKPVVRKTSDVVNYILSNSLVLFFLYFSNLSKFVSSQPNVNLSLTVWVCVAFVLHAKKRKRSFFSARSHQQWDPIELAPLYKGWGQSSCQSVYIFISWMKSYSRCDWCESVAHSNRQDWHWASDFSDEWTLQGSLWMLLHILSPLSIFSFLLLLSWQLLLITMAQDKEQLILPFTCVC